LTLRLLHTMSISHISYMVKSWLDIIRYLFLVFFFFRHSPATATYTLSLHDALPICLSVSRSIIESHHGRLWAAPNDGPGATFSFSLPRGPEDVMGAHSLGAIQTPALTEAEHVMRNP